MSSLVGIPIGVWLGSTRFPGRSFLSVFIQTGMALPPVVVGLLVYLLLSRSGPFGGLGWLFTVQAMIIAQVVLTLPFVVGITMASIAAVPPDLFLQVRSLGASPWQARWTVLREARSGVALALATALGRSFSEVGAVLMVGGNIERHTRVLTTAIMLETSRGRFGLALALVPSSWLLRSPPTSPSSACTEDRHHERRSDPTLAGRDPPVRFRLRSEGERTRHLRRRDRLCPGSDGAGKSTLLRLLSGLEPPSSGEILVFGQREQCRTPQLARLRRVTMVFQHPLSVTGSEGTTFSARWGPVRNDCVSVRWYPAGWLGSLADRL